MERWTSDTPEGSVPHIPELLLRDVWVRQAFDTHRLQTASGKRITIISPGTPNSDGGPDFLNARVRIGNVLYRGDIELHTDAASWATHAHGNDPHYNGVILHVVITATDPVPPVQTASHRPVPLLVLHPFLDERTFALWSGIGSASEGKRIPCAGRNGGVPAAVIVQWIERLAWERVELKVRRLEERLKQLVDEERQIVREPYPRYYGDPDDIPAPDRPYTRKDFALKSVWDQLLYEGVMEGLGYAKNREPFLRLAQSVRLASLRAVGLHNRAAVMALLFGAGGLLPSSRTLPEKESRTYCRMLRRQWKELRRSFRGTLLHQGDWLFFRLRPVNFPTARLAAFCFVAPLLFAEDSFRRMVSLVKRDAFAARDRLGVLQEMFRVVADDFWGSHYHFAGHRGTSGAALGPDRVNELLVNTILPVLALYARVFNEQEIRRHVREMLAALPPSGNPSPVAIIRSQLTGARTRLDSALRQQGCLQLHRFYCTVGRCGECAIGKQIDPRC